jgi:hypothetical protein
MATVDLGAIRFNWKGAYSGGTAYVAQDVVSSGGSSYVCILAVTGTAPPSATYWSIMAQLGTAGTDGTDGTNGTAGTNGTDVGTTITTQGDILFRDGSGLQRLAKGTAAQALKINAGATAPEWVTNSLVNADINASAAIDQSKLVDIVDNDISATAAIDQSKLAGLDATPTPDYTINGPQTNDVLAGYTTAIGDLVYLDPNGRWEEADANGTGTSISLLGIAMEVKSDGAAVNVALSGSFIVNSSWSFGVGVPLYIHTTAGGITATKPTGTSDVVRTVGYALTATTIFFAPSSDYVTLA